MSGRKFFLSFLILLPMFMATFQAIGQDHIYFRDSTHIDAKVMRIDRSMVRYQIYAGEKKKVLSAKKDDIERIVMEEGGELRFDGEEANIPKQFDRKHYISGDMAIAIPIRDFGSKDVNNGNAGRANIGYSFAAEGVYFINNTTGIGGRIGGFVNQESDDATLDALRFRFPDAANLEATSGTWESYYTMIGVFFSIPGDNVIWDLKLSVGTVFTSEPFFRFLIDDGTDVVELFNTPGSTTTSGIHFGTAARIPLTERVGLKLGGDFIVTEASFESRISQTLNGQSVPSVVIPFQQTIAIVTLGAGIAFHF